jgi:cyclopropane-fatty-acyl-phospholipid synthase
MSVATRALSAGRPTVAERFAHVVGTDGVAFAAYDGSRVGPEEPVSTVELRSPIALRYLAGSPGDLGLARAYVTGQLEVHGDLYATLRAMVDVRAQDISWGDRLSVLRAAGMGVVNRPSPPPEEAPPPWRRGLRHSKRRDAASISHHYDVSNAFYEMVLGPSMTYTCAVYESETSTLEAAQAAKYDLICRKLALQPGMRLLDVGCGWGGMVMHAAEHYDVTVLGVTLSHQQAEWAQKTIADRGLAGRAEVRYLDYRDVPETAFDAISSIGLTEHVGNRNLASYFASMYARLRPGGRLLNHCITRNDGLQRAKAGAFIDRYVFPDGELLAPGTIVSAMHDNGLEVRHEENLREHYAMTLRDWGSNLDANWNPAVAEVGERRARVWKLYMAASRAGFATNSIQLHQVLGVRPKSDGSSAMPLRPTF